MNAIEQVPELEAVGHRIPSSPSNLDCLAQLDHLSLTMVWMMES